MDQPVYLDHHATTPLDPRVLEAMLPYLTGEFGNPASTTHTPGRHAAAAVDEARRSVASLLGAAPDEILFTAGASESNNLALLGAARAAARRGAGRHLAATAIEHKSVATTLRALQREGFETTFIPPDPLGIIDAERLAGALRPDTVLVSIIGAHAEIGVVQPLDALAALCRSRGVLFHTDATQWVGKLPLDVAARGPDLLSLSAHKFYGPKGVGALFVRSGVHLEPVLFGGGQERGLRPGTLNVPGIVGLGAAARLRGAEMAEEAERLAGLRDRLRDGILGRIPGTLLNGCPDRRLPGNLNVSFAGCTGDALLADLDGFCLSTGSACLTGMPQPSEVLLALGRSPELARAAVRFGLGSSTRPADLDRLLDRLIDAVARVRSATPSA